LAIIIIYNSPPSYLLSAKYLLFAFDISSSLDFDILIAYTPPTGNPSIKEPHALLIMY